MTDKLQLRTVDHIGIVVKDCQKVIETWQRMFGVGPFNVYDLSIPDAEGNPLVTRHADGYLGHLRIQLLQVIKGNPAFTGIPEDWEGLQHICVRVDDLEEETANLVAQGATVKLHNPGQIAFLDCGGPDKLSFELVPSGATFTAT